MGLEIRGIDAKQEKPSKIRFINWIKRRKKQEVKRPFSSDSLKLSKKEMSLFDERVNGNDYVPEHELKKLTEQQAIALMNAGLSPYSVKGDTQIYDNMNGTEQMDTYSSYNPLKEALYASIDDPIYEDLDATMESKSDKLTELIFMHISQAPNSEERTSGLNQLIKESMQIFANGKRNTIMAMGLKKIFEKIVTELDIKNETPEFMEKLMFLHLIVTQKKFYGSLLMPEEIKSANFNGRKMVKKAMGSEVLSKFLNTLAQQSTDFRMQPKEIISRRFSRALSKFGIKAQLAAAH